MSGMNHCAARTAGFTLIEVLVAFVIAAVTLGAIYEIFSTGVRSNVATESYRDATLIGESALDALDGVPISAGESRDRLGAYERVTRITERPDLLPAGTLRRFFPYQIEVTVTWRDGLHERSVDFATLRLAAPPRS
jgi:general secretion pathway protein I